MYNFTLKKYPQKLSLEQQRICHELEPDRLSKIPPGPAREARMKALFSSRQALQESLKIQGIQTPLTNIRLTKDYRLKNFPSLIHSLSHTHGAAAAYSAKVEQVQTLGLDIEWDDRIVKEQTYKFYIRPYEDQKYTPLEIWSLKEAAFKAFYLLGSAPKGLKDIILSDNYALFKNQKLNLRLKKEKVENKTLLIAMAFLTSDHDH